MKGILLKVAKFVLVHFGDDIAAFLLKRAKELTSDQEKKFGSERSGEAKRHQVYSQMIKEFPQVSKRTISKAIEEAL